MIRIVAFALALASSPVLAQAAGPDLTYIAPAAGSWRYTPTATGSEATFFTAAGASQMTIRCAHLTRRITLVKPSPSPSSTLWVWTSLQSRSLPAAFDAANFRVAAELSAFDPLVDALASSRGRIGFSTQGLAPLTLPEWGDIARVVEDCRA